MIGGPGFTINNFPFLLSVRGESSKNIVILLSSGKAPVCVSGAFSPCEFCFQDRRKGIYHDPCHPKGVPKRDKRKRDE